MRFPPLRAGGRPDCRGASTARRYRRCSTAATERRCSGAGDFAILTLLSRLGLRAGEVAAIELGDIDWRAGEIVVRGKGNRRDRLPLPNDVGEALVAYLSAGAGRPLAGRCSGAATLPKER